MLDVLFIYLDFCYKILQPWWLQGNKFIFSQFLEAGSTWSRCWKGRHLSRPLFLPCKGPPSYGVLTRLVPHGNVPLVTLVIRISVLLDQSTTLRTSLNLNYWLKDTVCIYSHILGVRASTCKDAIQYQYPTIKTVTPFHAFIYISAY